MRSALLFAATLVAATLALAGCVTAPVSGGSAAARWPLLSPASFGGRITANQQLRAMHGEREFAVECAVDIDPARILVVGLLPAGPPLFTVSYDGERVTADSPRQVPPALSPERMLNDLQLAFWPTAALEHAFAGTEWRVTEPDSLTRRLLRSGALVAEVHYPGPDRWRGRSWLVNLVDGYSIAIDSTDVD